MKKLAGVVVIMAVAVVFSFSEYSLGGQESLPMSDVSDEIAIVEGAEEKGIKDPWLDYLHEILGVTLADTEKLIQIKKGASEQQYLGELKAILKEDIAEIEGGKIFSMDNIISLECHHESINLILEAIKKASAEGKDSSVAKTLE